MKKILFTGGTGFLRRNLIPLLSKKYTIFAPGRKELNLTDIKALESYIKENYFDSIIHAAIPNIAFNEQDRQESLLKNSLLTFLTLERLQEHYGKLIYFGSGAEFDKNFPIVQVSENDFGKRLPTTEYGLAKYTMNILCRQSKNIYNLRIFGCYGPTDAPFKFLTSVIQSCLNQRTIHLHQNCFFDFMLVSDLYPILTYFIENTPQYHDYNICTGIRSELTEICQMIQEELHTNLPVILEKSGFNHEYSGNNLRICQEIPNLQFTSLRSGIQEQIKYERTANKNEKKSC